MRRLVIMLVLALCAAACQGALAAEANKIGTAEGRFGMKFKPVDFTPPKVSHATLANGITLDYFGEKEPGLVTVLVQIAAGSVLDAPDKVGLASLTASIMRTGGSARTPGDKLDLLLDQHGAQMSTETDRERTVFRLSVLPSDLEWGMSLLAEILTDPALPQSKLTESVGRAKVDLRQRLDVPSDVARALFPQLVYGYKNPWGWTQTPKTLDAITTSDLRAFYSRYYRPSLMKLGMTGAVSFGDAKKLGEKIFGSIQEPKPELPPPPKVEPIAKSIVYVVPRETNQNVIYLGHLGIDRFSPLKFPVKLLNGVMSGGFTSRLFSQVRTARGLAYSVYGNVGEGTVRGLFFNYALTKTESTWDVLELMLRIDRELQQAPPTPAEIQLARESDINSFVFFFDTAEKIVTQKMRLDSFGYPADYLDTYLKNLRGVTGSDIEKAARETLHPDRIVVLIVGTVDAELRKELETQIGPVTVITEKELTEKWL
ncbi:insulinase family protein [bacterium]|nr:insulinase family protein [bacterium]